jgi:glycine/sarcosine N-methyltransferase
MRKSNQSFFDIYPHEYDALTNAAARVKPHRKEVAAMIKRFKPACVLDAGCATGLTSRLFAERSIATVGLDRSKAMVELARANNLYSSRLLSFMSGHFERLPKRLNGRFDLIVCLANSITGVGTLANLRKAARGFFASLKPGGHLVLQMLNYASIKEGQVMPIKATHEGNIVYERFSERQSRRLYVYVTRLDLSRRPLELEVFRHEMDNFSPNEMDASLRQAGFKSLKRFGDLLFKKRYSRSCRDLVVTAKRAP